MVSRLRLILWRWVHRIHDELHAVEAARGPFDPVVSEPLRAGVVPSVWTVPNTGDTEFDSANYEWDFAD